MKNISSTSIKTGLWIEVKFSAKPDTVYRYSNSSSEEIQIWTILSRYWRSFARPWCQRNLRQKPKNYTAMICTTWMRSASNIFTYHSQQAFLKLTFLKSSTGDDTLLPFKLY